MSDDEFEDEAELEIDEELAEDDEDDDLVEDLVDDVVVVEVDDALLDPDLEISPEIPVPVITDDTASETTDDDDEEEGVVDLDEELHPDDVEEPLDVLLQERTASATLEDDEEEVEDDEVDDGAVDGPARIVPRRADEFLCKSCFLVLPQRRLADEERQFCDDCA
jgi:hypothetical protein